MTKPLSHSEVWTHARQSAEKYLGITQHCDSVGSEGYQHAYRSDHAGGQYYWVWGCEQHTATTFMWANHIIIWLISLEGHLLLIIPNHHWFWWWWGENIIRSQWFGHWAKCQTLTVATTESKNMNLMHTSSGHRTGQWQFPWLIENSLQMKFTSSGVFCCHVRLKVHVAVDLGMWMMLNVVNPTMNHPVQSLILYFLWVTNAIPKW